MDFFNYDEFMNEIPEETRKLILKAMDIYAIIESKELVCKTYDSEGKIEEQEINKIDKRCACLFLAGLLVNQSMTKIMDDCGLKIDSFFEYLGIQNRNFKELMDFQYESYFKNDFKTIIDDSKTIRHMFFPVNIDNKDLFPEYIIKNLYYDNICCSQILDWMYMYSTNKISSSFNHVSFRMIEKRIEEIKNNSDKKDETNDGEKFIFRNSAPRIDKEEMEEAIKQVARDKERKFFEQYGVFLTSKEYITNPAIGREKEIENLELAFLTPNKSVSIVGEAGIGKTAVVEGLAYLIIKGDVPDLLKGKEILRIDANALVAGTMFRGQFEERLKNLLDKLKENKNIILFIDEMHSIIGAGTAIGAPAGFDNIIKQYLDRGDVKIIGATTEDEYKRYILRDEALKRRFEKVVVLEPIKEVCVSILSGTIPKLEKEMNIKYGIDNITSTLLLGYLVDITAKKYRCTGDNQNNPDLSLLILGKAFAFAGMKSKTSVTVEDIITSILRCERLQEGYRKKFAAIAFDNLYTTKEEAEKGPQFIKDLESCLY